MIHLYTCITKIAYIITKEHNQTRSLLVFSLFWHKNKCTHKEEWCEWQKTYSVALWHVCVNLLNFICMYCKLIDGNFFLCYDKLVFFIHIHILVKSTR